MHAILAIDQGTHASRALLFDPDGKIIASANQAIALTRKNHDVVEQNANEILESVHRVIEEVLAMTEIPVGSAALATQRSTLVAWDYKTGMPLAPAISWQDRRCASEINTLRHHESRIRHITGLPLSPHYLAGKIHWLLRHNQDVMDALQNNTLCVGPLASFLCFHLVEGQPFVVDHSNAARSLLFDLRKLDWDPELSDLFKIPLSILPRCHPTLYEYGQLIKHAIPLRCLCGDQNAAIHANGIPATDVALINIGSGAFVLQAQDTQVPYHPRLLAGIARSSKSTIHYLLEGTINGAGSALDALVEIQPDLDYQKGLPGWLDSIKNPPVYLNGFGGLGSPWWIEQLASRFIPETADMAQQAVAVVESIVFMLMHNLKQMDYASIKKIHISGGLSSIDALCQRITDLSGLPVSRANDIESTASGAAWLSTSQLKPWYQERPLREFEPRHNPALLHRYRQFTHELLDTLETSVSWYTQNIKKDDTENPIPRIVAHRGFRKEYPENTLTAILAAIDAGADCIEFDIQFSKDHVPMLFHDETLERTTGERGFIFDYSCEMLQTMQANEESRFSDTYHNIPIPTLDDVMDIMPRYSHIKFFVEVKRHSLEHFDTEKLLSRLLRDLHAHIDQCVLISFEKDILEFIRKQSDMAIGWVLRHYDEHHHSQARTLQPDYLICNHEKLQQDQLLWDGPWAWMLYEINTLPLATQYVNHGVRYISTADVAALKAGVFPDITQGGQDHSNEAI